MNTPVSRLGLTRAQLGLLGGLALAICLGLVVLLWLVAQSSAESAQLPATLPATQSPGPSAGFTLPPTWTATPNAGEPPTATGSPTVTRTPLGYADSPTPRPTTASPTPAPSPTATAPLNLSGLNPDQVTELAFRAFAGGDEKTLIQLYFDPDERIKYTTLYGSLGNGIAAPYRQKGLLTLEKWYVVKRYEDTGSPIYFSLVVSCWKEKPGCWEQIFSMYYEANSKKWLIFEHMHKIYPSQYPAP